MSETTTSVTEENGNQFTIESSTNAFLNKWDDAQKPSETNEEKSEPEATENSEEVEEVEQTEEVEVEEQETDLEEVEETEVIEEQEISDDDFVTNIKVGDDTHQVSVKELKRLYGQEKSLTQKSQQIAETRKKLEDEVDKTAVAFNTMLKRAEERFKPYAEIDMLVASKNMDTDQFAQLRKEAGEAYNEFTYLKQESDKFVKQVQDARTEEVKQRVTEARKELKNDVQDWNETLERQIRDYAIKAGVPKSQVDDLVEPSAFKILLKAMRYDEGKKVVVKKKTQAPKRVLKPGVSKTSSSVKRQQQESMKQLASTGSIDDATNAFLSKWSA